MAGWQPIGKTARPRGIAKVAVFLASDLSEFLTGTIIPVDGGVSAVYLGKNREDVAAVGTELVTQVLGQESESHLRNVGLSI